MNAKDLKPGDIFRLNKDTLNRLNLFQSHIGFAEQKIGAKVIVWFFTGGHSQIKRMPIGANTAISRVMSGNERYYHHRMLIAKYFDNGMSSFRVKEEIRIDDSK